MNNIIAKRIQATLVADLTLEFEDAKAKVLEIRTKQLKILASNVPDNDPTMIDQLQTNRLVLRATLKNVDATQEALNRAISAYRAAKGQE